MRIARAVSLLAFVVPFVSGAQSSPLAVGPYLLEPRPDGVVVAWESAAPVAASVIVETPTGALRFASPAEVHHQVRVAGLSAGSYPYRIVDADGEVLASSNLSTAAIGEDFTFLVYGDTRDVDADHARTVAAAIKQGADFLIHVGDMVRDGADEGLWRDFFRIEAPLLATTPIYPALGNHETVDDTEAAHFLRFFSGSGDGAGAARDTWYDFRYANSLFVALDGNRADSAVQAEWLRRSLEHADADPAVGHVFVFLHQAPLSNGIFCGLPAAQARWLPEFEQHRVLAVFAGHEHHYERLQRAGVRYFVTGGGGAPLIEQRLHCPAIDAGALERFDVTHHFLRVRVLGANVTVDAITPAGATIDSVTWRDLRSRLPVSREAPTAPSTRPASTVPASAS